MAMKRREFMNWVGLGWLAVSLPVAIAACTSDATSTTSVTPAAKGWQKVGTVAELDKTGQLLAQNSPVGAVLVVGTSKNPNNLVAVNPTCTHKGCTVAWKADQNNFACPCHDAKFAADGKVVAAPAKNPLKTYVAKIEGDAVLVQG